MDQLKSRLIGRLNTPFNQDPDAVHVFRVLGDWRLEDQLLRIQGDAFSTQGKTIGDLINSVANGGHTVIQVNDDLRPYGAHILMPGSGDGNRPVTAFTSLLWVLKHAASIGFAGAYDAIDSALAQLNLPQSTEEWADLFGQIFGVPRKTGEEDGVYTARIIEEVKRARSNPFSISANIRRVTGYDVEVREPWKELFLLSESPMDEGFHLQGAPIWQYHTAQLVARSGVKWPRILREAAADRPAGTIYLGQATHYPAEGIECGGHVLRSAQEQIRSQQASWWKDSVLSENLDLSNYFIIFNHLFVQYQLRGYWAESGISLGSWHPPATIAKGEVCLSEAPMIGDLQGHLPGAQWQEDGLAMSLSGEESLSDYLHRRYLAPIDEWFESFRSAHVAFPVAKPYLTSMSGSGEATLIDLSPQARWSGDWNGRTWWTLVESNQFQS